MTKLLLHLYITGKTSRSVRAVSQLQRICHDTLGSDAELVVFDVLEQPQLAERERIIATPTLIRKTPEPVRRIIGDMTDERKVLAGLDIQPASDRKTRY